MILRKPIFHFANQVDPAQRAIPKTGTNPPAPAEPWQRITGKPDKLEVGVKEARESGLFSCAKTGGDMVPLCRYIHPDGRNCKSPALRHQQCCYFHAPGRRTGNPAPARQPTNRPGYRWYSLQRRVPLLERCDIPLALTEIANALVRKEITLCRTRRLLKAIRRREAALKTRDRSAVQLQRNQ